VRLHLELALVSQASCSVIPTDSILMKYTFKIAATVAIIAIAALLFWAIRSRKELTTEQILTKTTTTYEICHSYQDSGTVKSSTKDGGFSINGTFTTAFIRPARFRYEFKGTMIVSVKNPIRKRDIHFIVWRQGKDTFEFYNLRNPSFRKADSFEASIAGATGISGGLTTLITDLLLPTEFHPPFKLTDSKENVRLKDGKIHNRDCYRISGMHYGSKMTFWIDKQTFLIRRMDWNGEIVNTTTREPSVNENVVEEKLEYRMPQQ